MFYERFFIKLILQTKTKYNIFEIIQNLLIITRYLFFIDFSKWQARFENRKLQKKMVEERMNLIIEPLKEIQISNNICTRTYKHVPSCLQCMACVNKNDDTRINDGMNWTWWLCLAWMTTPIKCKYSSIWIIQISQEYFVQI